MAVSPGAAYFRTAGETGSIGSRGISTDAGQSLEHAPANRTLEVDVPGRPLKRLGRSAEPKP
jgi:hypothetical protein